ncbi:spore germination protein A3 precursor [Clostridium acetireducens DSM 10703]|jgi:Ger(x)C family germination protein|uniref:Spore germination protein A3 n=1 Tax=Clostridium acetireducens DSM 10703 TaxID=1121290 RepID=A0A1E8EW50_9CLOT|nr:Ger(x)C family spore germination protein [Clostridium acetireducens]OFI01474.1 spore germination protein A3 precursor [Clostridium acetireducens DSM 10703]
MSKKNKKIINRKPIFYICILVIFIYSFIGSKGDLIENLNIPIGIGYDLKGEEYDIYILTLEDEQSDVKAKLRNGSALNIAETREKRSTKSSKKFIVGLEKIYILSEKQSEKGLKTIIDVWINNPQVNDRGLIAVCSGKSKDILMYTKNQSTNAAEYLEGIIKNLNQFNFFSKQFTVTDLMVRADAEGRNPALPYIDITKDGLATTGLALFKGDKMMGKTNLEEAKYINLLKYDKLKGILTIQKNMKEYISFYTKSRKKVKCYKKDGKYNFVINLNLEGDITNNQLYLGLNKDKEKLKKFTKDMEKEVKDDCNYYIDKIQNEYKFDVLGLGKYAAAKYGRKKGIDWNKEVVNSNIEVNVKVKVKNQGRGDY